MILKGLFGFGQLIQTNTNKIKNKTNEMQKEKNLKLHTKRAAKPR